MNEDQQREAYYEEQRERAAYEEQQAERDAAESDARAHHASAASSADPLPPSLAASLALFRENPEAWHDEWRRKQDFKVALIQRCEKAEAALAAADPALRTLSQQWREQAIENRVQADDEPDPQAGYIAAGVLEACAADLDRVCPEIRDAQQDEE